MLNESPKGKLSGSLKDDNQDIINENIKFSEAHI